MIFNIYMELCSHHWIYFLNIYIMHQRNPVPISSPFPFSPIPVKFQAITISTSVDSLCVCVCVCLKIGIWLMWNIILESDDQYDGLIFVWASLVAQMVKNPPAMWETWVWSQGWEDPLEEGRQPTPVVLPGESHGQRSLAGSSLWCCKESDMTEQLSTAHF